jgi:SAM-dependent methyltransferase
MAIQNLKVVGEDENIQNYLKELQNSFPNQLRNKRFSNDEELPINLEINNYGTKIINISETGACIEAAKSNRFSDNVKVEVFIYIQNEKQVIGVGNGTIMWVDETGELNRYGVHFANFELKQYILDGVRDLYAFSNRLRSKTQNYMKLEDAFKNLVFEMHEFLSTLKFELDEMEKQLNIHSSKRREAYFDVLKIYFEKEFLTTMKEYSIRLNKFWDAAKDKDYRTLMKEFYGKELGSLVRTNKFLGRAFDKPLGYAGDYEMMMQIYNDNYEGGSFYDSLIHRYGINEFSSLSVKFRKSYFAKIIGELGTKIQGDLVVGSLACGPAQEIVEFFGKVATEDHQKYNIVLMDQDTEALLEARRNVGDILTNRNLKSNVVFAPVSVSNIVKESKEFQLVNKLKFDLIYTAGLYDYLSQPLARLLTERLFGMLKVGGRLIIGNFHPNNPTKAICEMAADWSLIHRTENEMYDLVVNCNCKFKEIKYDEQKIEQFLEVVK